MDFASLFRGKLDKSICSTRLKHVRRDMPMKRKSKCFEIGVPVFRQSNIISLCSTGINAETSGHPAYDDKGVP